MPTSETFTLVEETGETILAAMRRQLAGNLSWSAVRRLLRERKVAIGGVLCIDEARRLTAGEVVTVSDRPVAEPPTEQDVTVRFVDKDIVVVEKPAGMTTLRRTSELAWSGARRAQQPTLDECVPRLIREHAAKRNKSKKIHQRLPRLFSVHRIDRDSSGLLVFARNEDAQKAMIRQFADHHAVRKYFALIPGQLPDQTIESYFVRDRGDGLRGSTGDKATGQQAITHVRTLRTFGSFSELECRLETGRTNQIRIHLAELGHPICGDVKYHGPMGGPTVADESRVHRLALHAAELKFDHPATGRAMHFETPWPPDMMRFLNRLQAASPR